MATKTTTTNLGLDKIIKSNVSARVFGILLVFLAWILLASVFPNDIMPYPVETLALAGELVINGTAFIHVSSTLWLTFWGFLGAIIMGGTLGVFMGTNDYTQRLFTPYVVIGLSVPAIAWAAIATLMFGFTALAPITATVVTTFPYIAINVWKGVENIDSDHIKMSESFQVSNFRILSRVILPSAAPSLFTAGRFGLAISWKVVTVAEMFAASKGVGYRIVQSYNMYRFNEAWAWAILFMIVILLIEYAILKPLERRVFEYRRDADFALLG
jgi:ABC-type nitrate/sulfonate/bicarbonate transport system permease component